MDVPAPSTVTLLKEVERISRLGAGQAAEPQPLTQSEADWSRIPRVEAARSREIVCWRRAKARLWSARCL
jgi:hypothetical protein